jgi:hypothetical protein
MTPILILEAIGPNAEQLATDAGKVTDIPVGYDSEFDCATFDSDTLEGKELEAVVFDALAGIDPEWQTHLRLAE